MKGKIVIKFLLAIIFLAVLITILTKVFVDPWVGKKIVATLNEKSNDYYVAIEKVHISLFVSGIEFKKITISSKRKLRVGNDLSVEIASIKFNGINPLKALFKEDIDINTVTIANSRIRGTLPFSDKSRSPIVSPLNISIGLVRFDNVDLAIRNTSTPQSFSVKEGTLKVYDLKVQKQGTLAPGMVKQFDFETEEFLSVSADSFYTFKGNGIMYSADSRTLSLINFSLLPNYPDYAFTARHNYESDRCEAVFSNLYVYDFPVMDWLKSGSLLSSYIEIGKVNVSVFRDKRKEFRHVNKPAFQDMIYNYPGTIRIDSISVITGNVTYTEHAEDANEAGYISFNEITAKIYKITNDTFYRNESASLKLKCEGLLMGKGRISLVLKAQLFDNQNTFSLNGTLTGIEAKELNPILEKNAYVYATSGKIDAMNLSFLANNAKATGKLTLLYHELALTVKNKSTDDTTAFKERIISKITNIKVIDSNPLPGDNVREGIIDYERDPEKFMFNYCFKAIFSGIKSTLTKSPKAKKIS